jgi:hypothetical protein
LHADTVIDLVVDGDVITTTEDHPFWSVTDRRFERADELEPGEKLLAANGHVLATSGLILGSSRQGLAYNLSIQGMHTYYVGASEVLDHNTCKDPLPTQGRGKTAALSTSQAADLARYLGYTRTNVIVKGERVFSRGGSFIVQDTTSHSGGIWKLANSVNALKTKSSRVGATDALLNILGT